ncbi:hypothetical protein [Microvirga makkahensis]|uniref:Uncharacterized protein n=1 Tax=Microvirga makkahensis TaxID=1128670 RepID=A0A7X3MVG7_9HYPH|nr:hypothetical protein [Microvirga makkahensis]MXQ13988.1 hypothetical protein [Microvirga makkahensis]
MKAPDISIAIGLIDQADFYLRERDSPARNGRIVQTLSPRPTLSKMPVVALA